jgi:HK97 gp10 family phage protein
MPFQGFQVSLDGAAEFRAALRQITDDAQKKLVERAAKAAGELMLPRVRERVPVRTGTARDHLQMTVKVTRPGEASAHIRPGKRGWYLKFFEYGTVKMAAQPVFGPAFDANADAAAGAAIGEFESGLEEVLGHGD